MKSMTGFGAAKTQAVQSQIEVNIRTVNGRFLEPRFHLPREYYPFESDLRKTLEKFFQRGTVDVYVARKIKSDESSLSLVVNKDLAKQYHKAFKNLAKDLKLKTSDHVETLARLPEVLKLESQDQVTAHEKKILLQTFEAACLACEGERKREGQSLQKELEKLLLGLAHEIEAIHADREEANLMLKQKFEQRLQSKLQGIEIDPARIAQEIVLQLEKSDINEELVRLSEHIKNYKKLIASTEAQGKKLDFYTQELLREVNTIGSKSSLSHITQKVVDAKTYIERLREQVQNIE